MSKATLMSYTRNAQQRIRELESENSSLKEQIKRYQSEKRDSSARDDMSKDGKIDIQNITKEMAAQMVDSFEQSYDEQSTQNIEDLRVRSRGSDIRVIKYDAYKKTYDELKKRFNL